MPELIEQYARVYDNLVKQDQEFPVPRYLQSLIRTGNIDFEGDMKEATEGSDFIKNKLLQQNR